MATHGGLNFAAFRFFVSAGFLLVVAVALFCGDTVASEASWASLRYLLAAPVPRARLLRQKLAVALTYSTVAIITLVVMALVAGTVAFGWHPLRLPGTGVDLPYGTAFARLGIVLGYVLITELVVAALAFLLSVSTDSPLGAVGGAVGLVIVSNILDAVTALGSWREILPTHWQFAWLDAVQSQVTWGGMIEGASVSVCSPWSCSRWPSGISGSGTSFPEHQAVAVPGRDACRSPAGYPARPVLSVRCRGRCRCWRWRRWLRR